MAKEAIICESNPFSPAILPNVRSLVAQYSDSQLGLIFPLRGCLAMSGDSFGCLSWKGLLLLASGKWKSGMLLNFL